MTLKPIKKTLEAFSAAALFSFSFAISALACSMILFASAIVCSGLSVVDSSVDRDDADAEVEVGVVANVDRVDSADSDGVEVDGSGGIVVVTRVDCMDNVAGLVANVGGKVVTAKLVVASHSSWMFAAPDETVLKQYSFPLLSPDLRQEKT